MARVALHSRRHRSITDQRGDATRPMTTIPAPTMTQLQLRNVAIIAHVNLGKTTLATGEQVLDPATSACGVATD